MLAVSSMLCVAACPGDPEQSDDDGDAATQGSGAPGGVSDAGNSSGVDTTTVGTAADSSSGNSTTGNSATGDTDDDTTAADTGEPSTGSSGGISRSEMSFFVSSAPVFDVEGSAATGDVAGDGNLIFTIPNTNPPQVRRGVEAADAFCQSLAQAAGSPRTDWVAYLSTHGLPDLIDGGSGPQVDARDRIGDGPWFNAAADPLADSSGNVLVNATLNVALDVVLGQDSNANDPANAAAVAAYLAARPDPQLFLTEVGDPLVDGGGNVLNGDWHDIFTGSDADGAVYDGGYPERWFTNEQDPPPGGRTQWGTCNDWDYSRFGNAPGTEFGQVGHNDLPNGGFSPVWNSAHDTANCTVSGVAARGGAGHVYCFSPG